jgi:hypothetical protein
MNGNDLSRLFMSYSNRMGLKLLNPKDFAAERVDRLDGEFAGFRENVPFLSRLRPGFLGFLYP